MKVREHGKNLIQMTQMGFVNVFLVREEDGLTLVDAGTTEGIAPRILTLAQRYHLPIVRLLLTHVHIDHVGALDTLHALLPNAEVLVGERESRFLARDMSLDTGEPQDKLRGGWPVRKTRPTRLLHEGERVGSLEVIATPGHTPWPSLVLGYLRPDAVGWRCLSDDGESGGNGDLGVAFPAGGAGDLAQGTGPGERSQAAGACTHPSHRRPWSSRRSSPGGHGSGHRVSCSQVWGEQDRGGSALRRVGKPGEATYPSDDAHRATHLPSAGDLPRRFHRWRGMDAFFSSRWSKWIVPLHRRPGKRGRRILLRIAASEYGITSDKQIRGGQETCPWHIIH